MINLNELTWDNFQQWPNSLKYFVITMLGLVLSAIFYFLGVSSNYYYYKDLVNEEVGLKNEFEEKHRIANLDAYKEQLSILKKTNESRLNKLVKNNEISLLLNEISQLAISSGLVFEFFAPKEEEKDKFPKELTLTLIVIGKYHNIVIFLNGISTFKKLIYFEDFEINKKEINGNSKQLNLEPINLLRMKVRVKIYKY
ncbi:Pilus assembly protein, PilO [Legionella massiliensis]|uniref:Pilus assembly protein, PilO n=2 Tax=Legionella massiliensis TaxID=1034943 RepID=A0A078L0G5_9GAMM|nr:Pilus assembly protein, PilO [Legionella massiliensis]CEE14389.1 Pilus assembly protein, PilO [Legionella massiliensis]